MDGKAQENYLGAMHNSYSDIIGAANGHEVMWWDENGVPRFRDHHPTLCPDIYADEVALLLISCQGCNHEFKVQMSWSTMRWLNHPAMLKKLADAGTKTVPLVIAKHITDGSIHYGDPPNIGCCPGGATMNCNDLRALEYWRRDKTTTWRWQRMSELEIVLGDGKSAPAPEGEAAGGT